MVGAGWWDIHGPDNNAYNRLMEQALQNLALLYGRNYGGNQ